MAWLHASRGCKLCASHEIACKQEIADHYEAVKAVNLCLTNQASKIRHSQNWTRQSLLLPQIPSTSFIHQAGRTITMLCLGVKYLASWSVSCRHLWKLTYYCSMSFLHTTKRMEGRAERCLCLLSFHVAFLWSLLDHLPDTPHTGCRLGRAQPKTSPTTVPAEWFIVQKELSGFKDVKNIIRLFPCCWDMLDSEQLQCICVLLSMCHAQRRFASNKVQNSETGLVPLLDEPQQAFCLAWTDQLSKLLPRPHQVSGVLPVTRCLIFID